jgi:hypothetical protein
MMIAAPRLNPRVFALASFALALLAPIAGAAEFDIGAAAAYEDPGSEGAADPGVILDAGISGSVLPSESLTFWGRVHGFCGYGSDGLYDEGLGASGAFFRAETDGDASYRWGLSVLRLGALAKAAWRGDSFEWNADPRLSLVLGSPAWSFFTDHEASFDSESAGFGSYDAKAGAVFAFRNSYMKPALVFSLERNGETLAARAGAEAVLNVIALAALNAEFSLKGDYALSEGGFGAEGSVKLSGFIRRSLDWTAEASAWYDAEANAAAIYPACGLSWLWRRNWSVGIKGGGAFAILPGADGAFAPPRWSLSSRLSYRRSF